MIPLTPASCRRLPAGAVAAVVAGVCLLGSVAAQPRPAPKGQNARQRFKNIKVLQNLPADQLVPVMREWSFSLGVRCEHCHVEERGTPGSPPTGFEKDTKPEKDVARKMFLMVGDLNAHQAILDKKATCFMCHHGQAEPAVKATFPQPGGPGRPGGSARPAGSRRPG